MSCEHKQSKLVENNFPEYVISECSVCGQKIKYSGLNMITMNEGIAVDEGITVKVDISYTPLNPVVSFDADINLK